MKPNPSETPESTPPVIVPKPSPFRSVLIWVCGVLVLLLLAALTTPMTLRCRKKADQTEAVNNARQIGMTLFEFETEYGKFPDASTIAAVRKATDSHLIFGQKSSNDFFRQLIGCEIAQSEAMFYAKITGTHKPDGILSDAKALQKGECGFTYFLGATEKSNPSRPLVVTAMIPGTDRFDPKRFDGKAVVLRLDNSVSSQPIDKDGHILIDGRNMMDPQHPIWEGKPPMIAWPDL
ncbi:MAG: hypothetical protein ABI162_20220 [Luteolibacter sp.]